MNFEGIRLKLRKFYIKKTSKLRKKKIKIQDLTIISNNCWGGVIYESYNLEYQSPTIGLFIMPDDYLKFINNLKLYIGQQLEFIKFENSKYYNFLKEQKYKKKFPIGKIFDVEIMFLHYKDENEARAKWERRCKRIKWEHLIFKFNDQNGCEKKHFEEFKKLKKKNKLFFTVKVIKEEKGIVFLEKKGQSSILASQEPFGKSRYIDINKYINNMEKEGEGDKENNNSNS